MTCNNWGLGVFSIVVIAALTINGIDGVTLPLATSRSVQNKEQKSNQDDVAGLMDKLLTNYSKHIRPGFGGDPINVTMSAYILDLYSIDEQNHEFTVNMILRRFWTDKRLSFDAEKLGITTFQMDSEHVNKIWKPDTFIINERKSKVHDLTMRNEYARVDNDGQIKLSTRFTVTASCKMTLGWFPFDRHTCSLNIESYAYSSADFLLFWRRDEDGDYKKAVKVSKEVMSIKFDVKAFNAKEVSVPLSNKTYPRLAMEFFLVRSTAKYIQDLYFPAIALTIIAFFTLHSGGCSETRLKICVFCMGAILLLTNMSSSSLPNISHQTALDFYIFNCVALILNAVLVHFGLFHFEKPLKSQVISMRYVQQGSSAGNNDAKEILCNSADTDHDPTSDNFLPMGPTNYAGKMKLVLLKSCKQSKTMLPIVFIIFNIIYWIVILVGSSGYPEDFLLVENRE